MRKIFILLLITASFSAISCSKDTLNTVRLNLTGQENFEIPPSSLLQALTLPLMPVKTNWEQQLKNNNTDKDRLKELKLKSLTLTVTAPSGKTLRFLKSIEIFIVADGLVEKKLAFKENISNDIGQVLELDIVDTDIAAYAKKEEFKLKINVTQDEINTDKVQVTADMLFGAVAYIIK